MLNTKGQEDAQEANLKNAQTVQQAAEARLQEGLATLPDVLEARSAAAQADYDLQAAIGATEIAHGDLATALGVSPTSQFQVESIQNLTIPQDLTDTVETSIDRALAQRPDLMQRVEQLRAAGAEMKAAKTAYLPTLSFDGNGGLSRTYGQQDQGPGVYSPNQETWDARLSLTWNLFDGFARENRVARAKADQKQAAAEVDAIRDQVENEVWSAYSTARTALRQQKAAAALLAAATESYNAALQSYNYGVRSQIDVVSAQRSSGCGAHCRCECAHPTVDRNGCVSFPDWRPALMRKGRRHDYEKLRTRAIRRQHQRCGRDRSVVLQPCC